MPLTDLTCRSAKPKEKPYKLTDSHRLYLFIHPNGGKYWRMDYNFSGKQKTLSIGVYPETSLSEAREKRDDAKRMVKDGVDPAFEKKKEKEEINQINSDLFENVASDWYNLRSKEWGARNKTKVKRILDHDILPDLGNCPIRTIAPTDLLRTLRKIEDDGRIPTAKIARSITGRIFRYAVVNERADQDIAAYLKEGLSNHKGVHRKFLEEKELPEFFKKLDAHGADPLTKLAIELMILCFPRTIELRGALKSEFLLDNPEKQEWRIPEERMKNGRPLIIPLSHQAATIAQKIMKLSDDSPYAFPHYKDKSKFMSENTMLFTLYRMGYRGKATIHGFRSTASTILNEHGFRSDLIEMQLSHVESNQVRASYNHAKYLSERREMMQWYADHIDSLKSYQAS